MVGVYSAFSLLKRTGSLTASDAALLGQSLEQQVPLYFSIINASVADFLRAQDCLKHNAFALNLRAGDALHIAFAKRHRLGLVTSDSNMAKAAKAFGISVTLI